MKYASLLTDTKQQITKRRSKYLFHSPMYSILSVKHTLAHRERGGIPWSEHRSGTDVCRFTFEGLPDY